MRKHTAVYMRVSTADQSLASQESELNTFCKSRGYKPVEFYADKVAGGGKVRLEFERMLSTVKAGKVERVVCYKLDRLGRSLVHLALVINELSQVGVPLIVSSQGIDTSADNPVGRLQLGVLMAVAEFERSIIRERVQAGLASAKARGVRLGGKPTLHLHKTEVYALRSQGLTERAIAKRLSMPSSSVHKLLHQSGCSSTKLNP